MTECKDRWKNIRGSYSKYKAKLLTKSGQGTKRVKEYYLAPHLLFLDPFLKSRRSKGNLDEEESDMSVEEDIETDEHETYSAEVSSPKNSRHSSRATSRSSLLSPSMAEIPKRDDFRKRKKLAVSATSVNDVNHKAYQYFDRKQQLLEMQNTAKTNTIIELLDPDLAFLHSVLPDMKSMNNTQKRHFKMVILSEKILSSTISEFPAPPTNISTTSTSPVQENTGETQPSMIRDSVNTNLNNSTQENTSGGLHCWLMQSMNTNSTLQGNTDSSSKCFNMNEFIRYNKKY